MDPTISTIESDILSARAKLENWLEPYYGSSQPPPYCGELDAGYPDWYQIESLVGFIFDNEILSKLSKSSIQSILFFISRNNECGCIIGWLRNVPGGPLSHCGNLSKKDFLFLCEEALSQKDDDCDYQLVNSFQKFERLSREEVTLLNRFFHKSDSYTRRLVIHISEHFALPQTIGLARTLWETDECEFAKLSCLDVISNHPEERELFSQYFREYIDLYDVNAESYRQSHIDRLNKKFETPLSS